jgi:hypothetical protein
LRKTVIENRKNQRFELRLPFEVVRSSKNSETLFGHTLNVSSSGVLFELEQALQPGEVIEYYLTLPTGQEPNEDVRLRCVGKVTRCQGNYAAATMERYEFSRGGRTTGDVAMAAAAS